MRTEQGAIKVVYNAFVPTFFVIPVQPVTDWYTGRFDNFPGRQEAFENMFQVHQEEIEIDPLFPPVNCYVGFYVYYIGWALYDPIAYDEPSPRCFVDDYSSV